MAFQTVNRWLVLLSAIVINICVGSAYAWSVYQKPLIELFGWPTSEASLAFTISLCVLPVAMVIAGKIQDQKGPGKVIFTGGTIFGLGMIGAGFTNSLSVLYCTYGVLGGFGIGAVYACTIANTVKFFPDKRGLASGLVVAGFGCGAVVVAPVSSALIEAYGILSTFKILGVTYLITISVCVLFVRTAPAEYRPPGWIPPVQANTAVVGVDKNWRQMLADPSFYILWLIFTLGATCGLMIIGHASPIGQEMIQLSPKNAAMVVSVLALANMAGRIFWGIVSDYVGRYRAMTIILLLSSLMLCTLSTVSSLWPFLAVIVVIGLCFGGVTGTFPSITADAFGAKNLGMNYGVISTGYGVAAFVGPRLASYFKGMTQGDYTQAFYIAAAMGVVGAGFAVVMQVKVKIKADRGRVV